MTCSITYLGDSTIVIFDNGTTVIIDESLEGWTLKDYHPWVVFKSNDGNRMCEINIINGGRSWFVVANGVWTNHLF